MNYKGPFSNVAIGWDGEPVSWDEHYHATADDANECPWAPDLEPWTKVHIIEDFYPIYECDHGAHPAECERCLAVFCIHEQPVDSCERCARFASGEFGDLYEKKEEDESTNRADLGTLLEPTLT